MVKTEKRRKGDKGEEVAFLYLKDNGYKILDRNYENRFGEIDIIAKKNKTIIFVEVKTRRVEGDKRADDELYPERNVDWKKQGKLIRAAEYYLIENKYPDDTSWQIDVIGVELDEEIRKANLRHIKNAVGGG